MRHGWVSVGAGVFVIAACAAQGSDSKTFGDQFDVDGGGTDGAVSSDAGVVDSGTSADGAAADAGSPDTGTATEGGGGGDGGCATGRVAVLSGSTTAALASVAGSGAFTTQVLAGATLGGVPALLDVAGAFQGAFRDKDGAIFGVRHASGAWTVQGRIGTRKTRDTPALAAVGAQIHLAYQDDVAYTYYHGVFGGVTWDTAADPVQGPAPAGQSFGPSGPALVGVGAEIVLVNGGGSEGPLYAQSYAGAAWAAGVPVAGTNVCGKTAGTPCGGMPGVLGAATATNDVLALHVDRDTRNIIQSLRKAADRTWSTTGAIRPTAPIATTNEQLSVARVGANRVVVAFRGTDQKAYAALGDLTATPVSWSAPTALLAATVTAPPQVAVGACGDDAIAVVASGGEAKVVRLRGTTWMAAEPVAGTTGATFATITSNGSL